MNYYVIIRGPLGCGKTTIAKALIKKIGATLFEVDDNFAKYPNSIKEPREKGYISQKTFLKINKIMIPEAQKTLDMGKIVVFDGNFYWKSSVEDLIKKLKYPHYVFTLAASLEKCVYRDANRKNKLGKDAVKAVYKKTNSFDYGIKINMENKTTGEIVNEILNHIK